MKFNRQIILLITLTLITLSLTKNRKRALPPRYQNLIISNKPMPNSDNPALTPMKPNGTPMPDLIIPKPKPVPRPIVLRPTLVTGGGNFMASCTIKSYSYKKKDHFSITTSCKNYEKQYKTRTFEINDCFSCETDDRIVYRNSMWWKSLSYYSRNCTMNIKSGWITCECGAGKRGFVTAKVNMNVRVKNKKLYYEY